MSNSLARLSCSLIIGLTINISSVSPAAEKQKQPSSPDVPISGQGNAEIAGLVHRLVNEFRQEHGLPPLTVNPIISAEASEHSADMAQHVGGISHRGFKQRFKNIQRKIPYRAAAENVAVNVGYNSPARAAVESWKQSREHRKNMLADFNVTGIGIAGDPKRGYYFTQIFVKVP
jgi:uncharacterized protein YkwD